MIKDSETPIPMQSGGVVVPEGVSFDGSTDYLSRASDLVGNVDSKTFTFSCWAYWTTFGSYLYSNNNSQVVIDIQSDGTLSLNLWSSSSGQALALNTVAKVPKDTFVNIIASFDMTSQANSKIYINDVNCLYTASTFANLSIDFTNGAIKINGAIPRKCRLSNLFLDYTYRDLSIEANRRLFITADGKPADGLASLNPILYLPMTDAATAHINEGTGGDFVQNGTLATADRGANQDNCVASEFDGVDDYLSSTGIGASDSKTFTLSFNAANLVVGTLDVFTIETSYSSYSLRVKYEDNGYIALKNSTNSNILLIYINNLFNGGLAVLKTVSISIDMTSQAKTKLFVNGVEHTDVTIGAFIDDFAGFNQSAYNIGYSTPYAGNLSSTLGELYFDTTYIDLATSNPFWDSDTNKPIPVRTAMANLGSNPLICMPIDASNPTKNYGSGGDFTLNGGGLVGARGASEYIARSVYASATSSIEKSQVSTITNTSTLSGVLSFKNSVTSWTNGTLFTIGGRSNISIRVNVLEEVGFVINGDETLDLVPAVKDVWTNVFYCYNGTTMYLNIGTSSESYAKTGTVDISGIASVYAGTADTLNEYAGNISNVYFTTDYIDFSQEANRNLFVSQLGYPRDLTYEIEAGNIPNPLIYLPFDDTTNLGKNLGTGGDFTVVGSVTAGADFNI